LCHNNKRLKAHWRKLIASSRYNNDIDRLSDELGKSPGYLRGLLRNDSTPGVDVVMGLCMKLGHTPDEMMNVSKTPIMDPKKIGDAISQQVSQIMTEKMWTDTQPSGEDIMRWWLSNNGRLENCDFIDGKFDLFETPDSTHRQIRPHVLGKGSLATQCLGTTSHDVYHRTIDPLSEKYRDLILTAQRNSLDTGPVTTIETLDAIHPDSGEEIKIEYTRTFAPVTMRDGKSLILNYSKLLRTSGKIAGNVQ